LIINGLRSKLTIFMTNRFLSFICFFLSVEMLYTQSPATMVAYAGGAGRETFFDVVQLSDSTWLVAGQADNLDWIDAAVPRTVLPATGINNGQGTNRIGFLAQFSADWATMKQVVHFAAGAVENIRYIKLTSLPSQPTGQIYISGQNDDTKANDGGYYIARLDANFVTAAPTSLDWALSIWAEGTIKENQPWDVDAQGQVIYIAGQSHAFDWGAIYALNAAGQRRIVEHWRTHWKAAGGEWRGTPASASPEALAYSGIVLKAWGRCDLRSWSTAEYQEWTPDGNGGTRRGLWPLDFLYKSPCDPAAPTADGPGYTGYRPASTPVHGGSCVTVDRRNGHFYLGMNVKSTLPDGNPDFEPVVVAMDDLGALKWWSRLYHEVTPAGDTVNSSPDQYVDGLAIDYTNDRLVVNARCHGNNVENLWEGQQIAANPTANGFQNRFTGSSGNIHISWLGKLGLADGTLYHSTYVAEFAEDAVGLGTPLAGALFGGWPNPNAGWPTLNTTRLAKNAVKVAQDGSVLIIGSGRRTMTTSDAHQRMPLPGGNTESAWNSFARAYAPDFSTPRYSTLLVGQWDTLTGMGGDNTELMGIWKSATGFVAVGRHKANSAGEAAGQPIPTAQVPQWGELTPAGESAIVAHFNVQNLQNPLDGPPAGVPSAVVTPNQTTTQMRLYPNPTAKNVTIQTSSDVSEVLLYDLNGRLMRTLQGNGSHHLQDISPGTYVVRALGDRVVQARLVVTGQ
jgi:hypothetical protein